MIALRATNFLKSVVAAGLVAAMLAASPAAAPAQATAGAADAQYVALAKAYYDAAFKLNPLEATGVGVHTYDAELGDFSAAGVAAQDALDNDTWTKLQAIDRTQLSPGVALDATLLGNTIQDDLLNNDTLATWKHNPDLYVQVASGAVFSVMSKAYAPLPVRLGYAIARERENSGDARAIETEHYLGRRHYAANRGRRRSRVRRFLQDERAAGVLYR